MLVAESYQWAATADIVHPMQSERNSVSHATPIGAPPFVMAGEIREALSAKGSMLAFQSVAASEGERLDCVDKSGSLNPRRCEEPASMPVFAAADQPETLKTPQSMGQNSTPDARVPVEVSWAAAQL